MVPKYVGWIVSLVILAVAAALAAKFIPEPYSKNPLFGLSVSVLACICVLIARGKFGQTAINDGRYVPNLARSNAVLWVGIIFIIGAFIWLFVGLGIAGTTSGSPAIAFVPFIVLVSAGSLMISVRLLGLLLG
ncbi:MAG TPA: hypothetical protein VL993_18190 [Stellaceae bacterium]|nr:hypothetical protein [Stellaceae bacterium]